jgi:hypothetical protein
MQHRLRQHNGAIKGGAVATTSALKKGHSWEILCNVRGFPTWNAALQFEWRWKQLSRKRHGSPMFKRIDALIELVNMDKPTSKAELYNTYEPLVIKVFKKCSESERLSSTVLAHAIVEYYEVPVL